MLWVSTINKHPFT